MLKYKAVSKNDEIKDTCVECGRVLTSETELENGICFECKEIYYPDNCQY